MRLPGWLRRDIGLKVAALCLAVFLWATVAERREVELTVDLPIKYTGMPADLVFATQVPQTAKARIRGKGKFLRWHLKDVYFNINLSAATRGNVTHVVSEGEAEIPSGRDIEVLEVITPKALRFQLDRLTTRTLPVAVRLKGALPDDKVMIGRARSDPATAVVDGANKVVEPLDSIRIEPVDLGQLAKKGRTEARIDLGGLPYVTSSVEKVAVSARIEDRKELGIPSVPIEAPVGKGEKALFTPDSLDVVISGAESQVDSLDPQDLRLEVDARDLPRGQLTFTPQIRDGRLYFEVRSPAGSAGEEVFEVKATLLAPYRFDLVSAEPSEIGFVKR
jgi:hypothetical protein